jgi:hypothetical protein
MKKPIRTPKSAENLEQQLEQLKQLRPEDLRKRWQTLFGSTAPPRLRSSLMVQAIARRLQEKALGGIKPATARMLQKVAEDTSAGRMVSAIAKKVELRIGTVLVREWHGSKRQVSVQKDGFLYRSQRYGSLSQIARRLPALSGQGHFSCGLKSRNGQSRGAS